MRGYFTTYISDNLQETPEGFLIAPGCVIARTGWQTYKVSDLPQQTASDLGVDVSVPHANIDVYRRDEDVFDPDTIASFEGKPVTDNHPEDFVDPGNFNQYAKGHIQNVRKGDEPLESGDWPLIADVHITAEPLLSKVRNKLMRELSCGYDFSIEREEDKICQTGIIGNHLAVVPKGRAGEEARINDAMPETEQPATAKVAVEPSYPPIVISPFPIKEKQPVAEKKNSWFRQLMGKHLIEQARATDADPDQIMDTAESMIEEHKTEDKKAKDEVEVPGNTQANEFKSADDKHADDRKRAHDMLDKIMGRKPADDAKAKDTDLSALESLLIQFLNEEKAEPEHVAEDEVEVDPKPLEDVLAGEAECPECGLSECECEDNEADPGQEIVESGEEYVEDSEDPDIEAEPDHDHEPAEDKRRAKDNKPVAERARAADGAEAVLKMLRPAIARVNDAGLNKTFNTALKTLKTSRASKGGGYGSFAASARARDKAAKQPVPANLRRARATDGEATQADPIVALQNAYNTSFKGGK